MDNREGILEKLRNNDIGALPEFEEFLTSALDFFEKVEFTHEFLDLLAFKIRESRSDMDKDLLVQFLENFLKKTLIKFGYDPRFVVQQGKTIVTYYRGKKKIQEAIDLLEFFIRNGITEEGPKGFHYQLDELLRLNHRRSKRRSLTEEEL